MRPWFILFFELDLKAIERVRNYYGMKTKGIWQVNAIWATARHAAIEKAIGRKASEGQTNMLA